MVKIMGLAAVGGLLITPQAGATLTFDLGTVYNGSTPAGSPPWMTATFQQAGANTVTLTLTANLGTGAATDPKLGEFIDSVTFNIAPSKLNAVTWSHTGGTGPVPVSMAKGENTETGTGYGGNYAGWDFLVTWDTDNSHNGIHRFNLTKTEVFKLTATGLVEADFNYLNSSGDKAHVGAHIQGFGNGLSGAIGDPSVPEPTTVLAGALLLLPFGASTLRILRQKRN